MKHVECCESQRGISRTNVTVSEPRNTMTFFKRLNSHHRLTHCQALTVQRLAWMWCQNWSRALAGVTSLKKQKHLFYSYLCISASFCAFFKSSTPFSVPLPRSLPLLLCPPRSFSLLFPLRRTHAGWSTQYVVLFNMHSPFLLLYYCPAGDGGPFLWPDNGRRRDTEHGGHVPFATPCYLSILPPFSPAVRFSIAP